MNTDSTTPNVFLGFSSNVLCLLLESLAQKCPGSQVTIVENMPAVDGTPFFSRSKLSVRRLRMEEWSFNPANDRLMFSGFNVAAKMGIFRAFTEAKGIQEKNFGQLVSGSSVVACSAEISPGCCLEPATVIAPFTRLEFGVSINRGVTIGHHVTIGSYSYINPGTHVAGHCRIGERVTIGIGAVVFDHISIGEGSIVGGGSVVTRDIPAGVVAFGNPCKVVKRTLLA